MENIVAVSDTITAKEIMTSVEIAELTGRQHSNVLRDIRNILEQIEDKAQFTFELGSYLDANGQSRPLYNLTKKDSILLASGYDANLRARIINRWEQLEIEKRNGGFLIPKTYSAALMLAAKQAEQIEQQQKLLEIQKPKVEFFDAVAESKTAVPMNDVAKVLQIKGYGRNNLFEFLRQRKILMMNNQPYQKFVDAGYFRVIEQKYQRNNEECISFKTLVYQKGIDFIRKLLNAA